VLVIFPGVAAILSSAARAPCKQARLEVTVMQPWQVSYLLAFRPRGVPGPTSKLSLRVPAQMGRRETEHKGEKQ
jgi:hypothetical protein